MGDGDKEFLKAVSEKKKTFINTEEKYKDVRYNLNFKNFMTEIYINEKKFNLSLFGESGEKLFMCL